jgi:hypothetical protein
MNRFRDSRNGWARRLSVTLTATALGAATVIAAPTIAGAALSVTATVDANCKVTIHGSGFTSADLNLAPLLMVANADAQIATDFESVAASDVLDDGAFDVTLPDTASGTFNFKVTALDADLTVLATGSIDTGCAVIPATLQSAGLMIEAGPSAAGVAPVTPVSVDVLIGDRTCTFQFQAEIHGLYAVGIENADGSCGIGPDSATSPAGAATLTAARFANLTVPFATPNLAGTADLCGAITCIAFFDDTLEVDETCTVTMPNGEEIRQLCPSLSFTVDPMGATLSSVSQSQLDDLGAGVGDQIQVTAFVTVSGTEGTTMTCQVTGPATVTSGLQLVSAGLFVGPCSPSFLAEDAVASATLTGYMIYGDGFSLDVPEIDPINLVAHECSVPTANCVYGFQALPNHDPAPVPLLPATPTQTPPNYTG